MEMILLGIAIGAAITAVLVAVAAIARAGSVGKAFWGLSIAGRANVDPAFAIKLNALLGTPAVPAAPSKSTGPAKPSGEPLRLLALLQTEARLVDFLMEDIAGAQDVQVGQAVREIHTKAQRILKQYVSMEPILADAETVTVPKGFDPASIRVVGNVTGEPPFTGKLDHPGWKVTELKLPPVPEGQNLFVIQPAEVQLP